MNGSEQCPRWGFRNVSDLNPPFVYGQESLSDGVFVVAPQRLERRFVAYVEVVVNVVRAFVGGFLHHAQLDAFHGANVRRRV
jgi:hypothetical protein